MRKVKLLALLLAALMVVTAFAGCADTKEIESDVANLDERVTALEGKVDSALSGIEDVKEEIANGNDSSDEDLKAIQDALAAQEATNKALLEKLEQLQKDLDDANKKVEDLPTADEGLAQAQKDAAADIAARKAVYENNKADYVTKDYEAILTILEVAKTEVAAATKSADVKAIVAQMNTDLAKYTAYDDQLYIYVTTLLGNISADTEDLVEEAKDYLKEAKKHYGTSAADLKPLTEYVYGVDEDDEDLTIDLVAVIGNIDTLQNSTTVNSVDVTIGGETETYATLNNITEWAKRIDKAYKKLDGKVAADIISSNEAGMLYNDYNELWLVEAEKLGEKNTALVTKAAEIADLAEMVENVAEAKVAYGKLGKVNYSTGKYVDVLAAYDALENARLIDYKDGKNTKAAKKTVYDVIDAKIDAWKTEFGFDDEFAAAVIKSYYGDNSYENYAADRDYIAHMEAAYASFGSIADAIADVNATELPLSADEVSAYLDLEAALAEWRIVVEEDEENDIEEVPVDDDNFELMLIRKELLPEDLAADATFFNANGEPVMTNIVVFEEDNEDKAIATFFADTYDEAKDYALALRKAFKTLNDGLSKKVSVLAAYKLEGEYKQVATIADTEELDDDVAAKIQELLTAGTAVYVVAADYEEGTFTFKNEAEYTIAEFTELYSDYGLMALLDTVTPYSTNEATLATFESCKTKLEDLVADAKDSYADVVKAVEDIDYQKAWVDTTVTSVKYQYSPNEIEGADVVYLVNLDDKAAVEAAVAARLAWNTANRAGKVQEFVEYVYEDEDEKEVVLNGVYVFEDIRDANVNAILDEVAAKVSDLSEQADALVAHFENLAAAMAFFATEDGADYDIATTVLADYGNYAVTSLTTYNNQYAVKHYLAKGLQAGDNGLAKIGEIYNGNVNPVNAAGIAKVDSDGTGYNGSATTLASLLDAGYTAYKNFCKKDGQDSVNGAACNVSYTVKTELVNGAEVTYYKMAGKTYSAVETAIKALTDLDVAYTQARIISKIEAAEISAEKKLVYIAEIKKCDTKSEFVAIYDLCLEETGVTLGSVAYYNNTVAVSNLGK